MNLEENCFPANRAHRRVWRNGGEGREYLILNNCVFYTCLSLCELVKVVHVYII